MSYDLREPVISTRSFPLVSFVSFPFATRFPSSCSVRGIEMALDGYEDKFFLANKLHYVSTRDCANTASRDLHGLGNKI